MLHAKGMATVSAVVVTSAFGGLVSAATLNVPQDFDTIQGCIDAAVSGADECVVAPGTYNEVVDFLGKAITLRSSDGADVTIIDGTGLNDSVVKCVSGEGPDTVLDGFTITGGTGSVCFTTSCGGGMFNRSSIPTVTNCTFSGNTADLGGGMSNFFSNPTVTNCTFSGNSANFGGGMYNLLESNPTVTNCTFTGSTAGNVGGGMFNVRSSNPTVTNCILWGDSPEEIFNNVSSPTSTPTISFSDVQGGWAGEGNIDVDPLFVDADGLDDVPGTQDDDLRLLPGSHAIDAADNTAVPTGVTTDLDGNPRFVDDPFTPDTGNGQAPIVDMGAYEFQEPLRAGLDIKPGSCPNPLNPNPKGKGVVPMALVGSESFDVTNVNPDTLVLTRLDGVGEIVFPLTRSRGQTGTFEDVTGPAGDDPCACSEAGGDGFDDLVLKFSSREMVRAFQLDSLERSASLTIALRGQLFDGTEFAALDCVRIVGSANRRSPEVGRAIPVNP